MNTTLGTISLSQDRANGATNMQSDPQTCKEDGVLPQAPCHEEGTMTMCYMNWDTEAMAANKYRIFATMVPAVSWTESSGVHYACRESEEEVTLIR